MQIRQILAALDTEISRLQQARQILSEVEAVAAPAKGNKAQNVSAPPQKREMSVEGKARIAAAQKKRWAAQRKATAAQKALEAATPAKPSRAKKNSAPAGKGSTRRSATRGGSSPAAEANTEQASAEA